MIQRTARWLPEAAGWGQVKWARGVRRNKFLVINECHRDVICSMLTTMNNTVLHG